MAEHDRILGYFLEEAKDHLNTIEQGLRKLPETVRQPATIRELFRAAHSIKGSAAMLGLLDVQQVGNQFEANFKLLKEQPTIAVDPKLQNLFLESFSFLRAAITEVSNSSDPYRRDPASPDPVGDPVFEELKSYLQQLLHAVDAPTTVTDSEHFSQDPAVEQVFGEYVTRKLGEINSLCLQPDTPEIRTQIQQICQKLGGLGDNFEFLEWTNLFTGCRLAVANPHNTLHHLGESISIAVKQAQILILADRHQAIGITPDLEALIDRKNSSVSLTQTNTSTFQLDWTPDRFAANGSEIDPMPLESTIAPGLSSIYERVEPLQLDDDDRLAEFIAAPQAQFTASDLLPGNGSSHELDEFMQNMLREELPNDRTWMQDDEFGGSDGFDLDFELDKQRAATPAAAQADRLFAPSIASSDSNLPASAEIDHDAANFFSPDLANFWSNSPFDQDQSPLYGIDGIDLTAHVNELQLQPEQPLDRDLDPFLPDFTLDARPMSALFPTPTTPIDLAEPDPVEQSMLVAEPLADSFNDFAGEFSLDDVDEDLQLNQTVGSINPAQSVDSIEQKSTTHQQLEASAPILTSTANDGVDALLTGWLANYAAFHEIDDLSELDLNLFGMDESSVDASGGNDFTDLDLSVLNLAGAISTGSDGDNSGYVDLEPLDRIELVVKRVSERNIAELDLDFHRQSSGENRDFAEWDLDLERSECPIDLDIDRGFINLAAIDPTEPGSSTSSLDRFMDFDLDVFNHPESVPNLSLGDDFVEADAFGDTALLTSSSDNDFADLDLGFSDPGSSTQLSISAEFAGLNLAELDEIESNSNISDRDDFANLDFNHLSSESLDRLADIGSILDANAGISDLDALLLNPNTVGIGGVALATSGSTFDDLDALVGTPAPANDLTDLDGLLGAPVPVVTPLVPATAKAKSDRRVKQRTFEQTMRVSVRHLDNLNNLVGELVVNRNTLEQDQNRMRQFIEKLLSEVQKLNEVGKRMQDLYERSLMENSLIASRQQSKLQALQFSPSAEMLDQTGAKIEYDPLEMDRFTPIHLLSQKMIELTVRVRESTADIEFVVDGSTEVTRTLRQITGQLQEDLTKSRMIPFAQTADRLQRGVRDNGLKYGKQVELSIEGRDTLIDKVILESLSDPLIHMVNNAIAHGIESAEIRLAAGKPAVGTISVRAIHQGNQTIISIADDGAGINAERVKTKAIEKGIITAQQALTMTKAEVYDLLFLPSFSTKDEADELAGRGVGMDVVRTSLNDIRGTITTESQLGIGTTFTIRLPLALSIAKALIAVNKKKNIAFPMDGIEDTQDVSPEQIQTNSAGEPCIFWRDNLMPFKPLSDLLGFNRPLPRNNFYGTHEDDTDLVAILVLRSDGHLLAVQVDKIIGDQEIVIKPLQGPAAKPLGIAGATVLGDGQIVPIADVMELIDLARGTLIRPVSTQLASQMILSSTNNHESMVLIVDDSITVRELLSLTFKRAGYRVEQARDGQEAWDKLRSGLPCDIVFCDIEMPRMDGLEFLSRVQQDPTLSQVPVAMLTSRGSDRHRQIAAQLGASGYFIKPYLEEALLDAAKRMIKGEVLAIV